MQTANAIKKLEKAGLTVNSNGRGQYWADTPTDRIDWVDDMGNARAFYVKGHNVHDDIQTDCFCGVWCQSLKQAMRLAGLR